MLTKDFLMQDTFDIVLALTPMSISRSDLAQLLSLNDRQIAAVFEYWEEVHKVETPLAVIGLLEFDNTEEAWRCRINQEFAVTGSASQFFDYERARTVSEVNYVTTTNFVFGKKD